MFGLEKLWSPNKGPVPPAAAPSRPRGAGQPYGNAAIQEQLKSPERVGQHSWIPDSLETLLGLDRELRLETPKNKDVTDRYGDLSRRSAKGENTLPADAKDYAYLNVGGLFTEHYPGYMDENEKRMKDLGLDTRRVGIDTDASVDDNTEVIRQAILDAVGKDPEKARKVVLTGHSKGGVDIATTLQKYPELAEHVRAVVSMQAPWGGTPVGSLARNNGGVNKVASTVITKAFGGNPESLTDLSYEKRRPFNAAHPYPEQVPTVSLATSNRNPLAGTAATGAFLRSQYGLDSDGLVPTESAVLPGSDVVRLDDMDHAGPVMAGVQGVCTNQKPADVTQALLTLALEKANRQDRAAKPGAAAGPSPR